MGLDMGNRLRIKFGHIEFEYEGATDFGQEAIKDLFTYVESFAANNFSAEPVIESRSSASGTAAKFESDLHTETIASRLNAATGKDLAIAAAACLHFSKGKDKFTRAELAAEMRSTPSFFKK